MTTSTVILFLTIFASILFGYYLGAFIHQRYKNISARDVKKDENKKRVLQLMKELGEVRNDDVEKLLGVSDATATRYFDELEREGKITQHGKTKGVFYTLN